MKGTKIVLVVAILAMVLASCAPAATPTPVVITQTQVVKETQIVKETQVVKETVVAEPTAVPQQPAKQVNIVMWQLLSGTMAGVLDAQVARFNASQSRIKVEIINQGGYDGIQQKMLAALAAGGQDMPHVTMIDYINVPFYAQEGTLVPLDDYFTAEAWEDFIPGLLEDLKYNGKTYAVPANRSTQGLYYNKDLFRAVGLDPEKPPQTWDEFAEYSKILTDPAKDQYGTYSWISRWYFPLLLYGFGGQMNDAEGNCTYDSPEGVAAMSFLQNLKKDGVAIIPANLTGAFELQASEFVAGQIGMMFQSTAILSWIGDTVPFDWGFAMMPAGPAGRYVTHGAANYAVCTGKSPEETQAAIELVDWLSAPTQTAEFHMKTGYMAGRWSALELPETVEFYKTHPYYKISVQQLEWAHPTSTIEFSVKEWGTYLQQTTLPDILINERDVATVLNESCAYVNELVEGYRAEGKMIIR